MQAIEIDSPGWNEIVGRFGGEEALAASAFAHRALRRKREITSAGDLLRLTMIYGPGGHSLRMAAALVEATDMASLSDVAVMKRVAGSAAWLEALCNERLAMVARAIPQVAGSNLRIRDATVISAPGHGGRYMLHMSYAPEAGRIADFAVVETPCGESLERLPACSGDLLIGDRAYPQPDAIRTVREKGCEVLLRLTWKSLRLTGKDGAVLDWRVLLDQARAGVVDMPVQVVRARGRFVPLPLRLVILSKPQEAAEAARKRARHASLLGQCRTHDPRTQAAADCLILLTSLPPETISPERLRELYALRWQIEIAFKRMKSILDIGKLPAKNPALARAWLFAHLLVALLADDIRSAADAIPP